MVSDDWKVSMRPTNIEAYQGNLAFQKFYKETLLGKKEIPTSILFQGRFGCGKSTAAKLVAQTMVCKHPNADGSPCCNCSSCKSIMDNKFDRDVKFINGGDSNKQDISEKIDSFMQGRPMFENQKIMIIDEVQQLSEQALNALLIAMETTRKDIHFLFTAMENIKTGGFKSRCRVFEFRQPSIEELAELQVKILKSKNLWDNEILPLDFKLEGLHLIAESSEGSYRVAIDHLQHCVTNKIFDKASILDTFEIAETSNSEKAFVDLLTNNLKPEEFSELSPKKGYLALIDVASWIVRDTGLFAIWGELSGIQERNIPRCQAICEFETWKFFRDELAKLQTLSYISKAQWETLLIKTIEYGKMSANKEIASPTSQETHLVETQRKIVRRGVTQ